MRQGLNVNVAAISGNGTMKLIVLLVLSLAGGFFMAANALSSRDVRFGGWNNFWSGICLAIGGAVGLCVRLCGVNYNLTGEEAWWLTWVSWFPPVLLAWWCRENLPKLDEKAIAKRALRDAIFEYTAAIQLEPQSAEAHHNRAVAYAENGDLEKSICDETEAVRLKPELAKAYYNRGIFRDELGDRDKALDDYTTAIRAEPDFAAAYCGRGVAYLENGDLDKAIADFSEAIRLSPDLAEAYQNRSVAYSRKGENSKAAEDYARAIAARRSFPVFTQVNCLATWKKED